MTVFIALTMIDNLLNSMDNPIYMVMGGGLIGMLIKNPVTYLNPTGINISDLIEDILTQGTRFIGTPDSRPARFIS